MSEVVGSPALREDIAMLDTKTIQLDAMVTLGGGMQTYFATPGDTVQAGNGTDFVIAAQGQVTVTGATGTLVFIGGTTASNVAETSGTLIAYTGSGGGALQGGSAGHNLLVSGAAAGTNATLTGGGNGDLLVGSAHGNDLFYPLQGRETVDTGGGTAQVVAGFAPDVINTGSGATSVTGGAGVDTINGGSGFLQVLTTGDRINAGSGTTSVIGAFGGSTNTITGGAGALDVAAGNQGMLVTGGAGALNFVFGAQSSTITEGTGNAMYQLIKGDDSLNTINGFRPATDKIELSNYNPSDLHVTVGKGSTLLALSDGSKIDLVGVTNIGHSVVFG